MTTCRYKASSRGSQLQEKLRSLRQRPLWQRSKPPLSKLEDACGCTVVLDCVCQSVLAWICGRECFSRPARVECKERVTTILVDFALSYYTTHYTALELHQFHYTTRITPRITQKWVV